MKKIVCIIVATCLLMIPTISLADTKATSMTVVEAQKIAIDNSTQKVLDDIDIKSKQAIVDSYENVNVKPLEIGPNLEVAKRNKVNNINTLKLNVYKAALDIILAEKQLDTEKQKLAILTEKLNMVKSKLKQNTVTENEVNDAQYNADSKGIDVEKLQDSLDSLNLDFKRILNLPLDDSNVIIKEDLVYSPLENIEIDNVISKAETTNTNVYKKSQVIIQKQNVIDDIVKYRGQGTSYYFDAQYDLESAKIDLDDAMNTLEMDIRNKYNDLLNSRDKVVLATRFADLTEKKFKVSDIKYKNGMISKESYLNDKQSLLDAQYQEYVAIHDFNIAKAEFDNMISQ